MMENNQNRSFEYTYSAPMQEEIKKIKEKYLPKEEQVNKLDQIRELDRKVEQPGSIIGLVLGIVGTLLFGLGMTCTMVWTSYFVVGIILGIVGMIVLGMAYPMYRKVTEQQKEKLGPEILKLIEELE